MKGKGGDEGKLEKVLEEIVKHFGGLLEDDVARDLAAHALYGSPSGFRVEGRVERVYEVRRFTRNGKDGKVARVDVSCDGDALTIKLWDRAAELVESGEIIEGAVLRVRGRRGDGEIHVRDPKLVSVEIEFTEIGKIQQMKGRVNLRGVLSGVGELKKGEKEIYISDSTGRVKIVVDRKNEEVYWKGDIGDAVEVFNARVCDGFVYADRNSRIRFVE